MKFTHQSKNVILGVKSNFIYIIKSVILYVMSPFIFTLSKIFPKYEDLIVFANGSEQPEFSGNMKYLFLELSQGENKECVWITEYDEIYDLLSDSNYCVQKENTLAAKIQMLRADHAVTSVDFSKTQWAYLSGATKFQLWHGIPLKSLPDMNRGLIYNMLIKFDIGCLTGSIEEEELRTHKNIETVEYTGYPRNDTLFREVTDSDLGVDQKTSEVLKELNDKTVIGYFPTWRENGNVPPIKTNDLNEFLGKIDAHFVIKPHRYMDAFVDDRNRERIHVLPPCGDIYPLLKDIDVLVTDYSSIYFDYLFLDRPIVYYPYDYEEYAENRGFNLEYDQVTPGPKAHSFPKLLEALQTAVNSDGYRSERSELRSKVFQHEDGKSVERIREIIL